MQHGSGVTLPYSPRSAATPLSARWFRCRLCGRLGFSSATLSKIRISLLACRDDLRVDLRQALRGLFPLRRSEHNRPNTIRCHPKTHLGAVVSKTRPCTCRRDLGAGMPAHSLSGRRLSGRKLSGLCQHNEQTNQDQVYGSCAHGLPLGSSCRSKYLFLAFV
jgi:hypothetical protein